MKAFFKNIAIVLFSGCLFSGCLLEEKDPFTGIKIDLTGTKMDAEGSKKVTVTFFKDDKADYSADIEFSILNDSTEGAFIGTSGTTSTTVKSGTIVEVFAGSKACSSFTVKASYSTYVSSVNFSTRSDDEYIRISDKAIGFANVIDTSKFVNEITVSTASALQEYAKKGGYVIYVDGVIDMSGGILPEAGKNMDGSNATAKMNEFIAANSNYKTYSEWVANMTSNNWINNNLNKDGDTPTLSISNTYKNKIQINVASNTAIVGLEGAVVRGCNISIGNVSNVVIRNITLQDAVDPFPHHENGDGWNAQHDVISIDRGTNIWIDHCTLEDTLHCGTAANGEKWQVYDGLCDMKSSCTNITVSYCHFKNHDKTMLIGSGDSDGDNTKRFVTLAGNHFENCGQRLPMVRNTRIHVYGNYYENDGSWYRSQSSINARKNAIVCEHNNRFASGASPSTKDGYIYSSTSSIFDVAPRYEFALISPSRENAGAGILGVKK